jgi:hypothetical protein
LRLPKRAGTSSKRACATSNSKEKGRCGSAEAAETRLQSKLRKYAKHGALTLTSRADRVVVALEPAEGRLATTPEPTPANGAVLCGRRGRHPLNGSFNVEVLAYAEAGNGATTWAQAADRATLAAQTLHESAATRSNAWPRSPPARCQRSYADALVRAPLSARGTEDRETLRRDSPPFSQARQLPRHSGASKVRRTR